MNWFSGSIPDAIAEAKSFNKVFLVYIEGNDDLSKKMTATYDDPAISKKLNSGNCVALKLTVESVSYQQFCQIYPVVVIPSSFFIGKNGIPIEILPGYTEPSAFSAMLDMVFQFHVGNASGGSDNRAVDSSKQQELQTEEPMQSTTTESSTAFLGSSSQPTSSVEAAAGVDSGCSEELAEDKTPLEDRLERAKSLLDARRQNKAVEEQEKEKTEEQERRKHGKALQKAQQTRHEIELKEWAQTRAKEKEEERVARERVRAQIAQDRAERAAKYQQVKAEEVAAQKEKEMTRMKEEQERSVRDAALRSTIARLQFRLPDGTSVTHQFPADSTLEEARRFVIEEIRPSFPSFTLCTTFPRRHFTDNNFAETLRDLQLAPSAAILVLPGQAVTSVDTEGGLFASIFWTLVSPFLTIWRTITSKFRRSSRKRTEGSAPTAPQPGTSGTQPSTSKKNNSPTEGSVDEGEATPRNNPQRFYKKEGNIFRMSNQPTDDDDNNTWNGNSTQQM